MKYSPSTIEDFVGFLGGLIERLAVTCLMPIEKVALVGANEWRRLIC
jgi:hypothetical protein